MKAAAPTGANIALFLAGLLFGLGLAVSGMINPAKTIGFLDLAPASLFGIGWGIAGFCPGPGLVALNSSVLLFVTAMLAGMALHRLLLE